MKHRPAATAETRYAALVDAANEAIVSADVAGTILTWNRAAVALYGYTENEIIGQPLNILVPPARAGGRAPGVGRGRAGSHGQGRYSER